MFFAVGKIEPLIFDLSWPRPRLPVTRSQQKIAIAAAIFWFVANIFCAIFQGQRVKIQVPKNDNETVKEITPTYQAVTLEKCSCKSLFNLFFRKNLFSFQRFDTGRIQHFGEP